METPKIEIRRDAPDEVRLMIANEFEKVLRGMLTTEDDPQIRVGIDAYLSVVNDLRGLLKAVIDVHNEQIQIAAENDGVFDYELMRRQVAIVAGSTAMSVGSLLARYTSRFDLETGMLMIDGMRPVEEDEVQNETNDPV